jgi:O-antigen/teichoic acid export membrane protein
MTSSEKSPGSLPGPLPGDPSDGRRAGDDLAPELIAFEAMAVAPTAGGPVLGNEVIPFHAIDRALGGDGRADDTLLAGVRHAGPLAIAGLVSNGANVIVTVLVARLLTAREYGALADLLSLFLVISMPGSALLVGVVRRVTEWRDVRPMLVGGDPGFDAGASPLRRWSASIHHRGMAALAVLVAVAWIVQGVLSRALGLPGSGGVVEVIAAGGVWLLLSVDRGVLQAHRLYAPLAGNLLVEGGVRTLLTIGLTAGGLGVAGAAGGILAAELTAALHARWLTRTRVMSTAGGSSPGARRNRLARPAGLPRSAPLGAGGRLYRIMHGDWSGQTTTSSTAGAGLRHGSLLADSGVALASLALLAVLQNIDVIFVGRYDPAHSGSYAAISVASKAIVFGAVGLGSYLLPEAAIRWHRGGHALRQLGATVLILTLPAVALLVVAAGAPTLLLRIVFGPKLTSAAPAFATLAGAMVCLAATVVMTNYLLGVGWRWIVLLLMGGTALAAGLVGAAGGGALATARADLLVQGCLTLLVGSAFAFVHHRADRLGWSYVRLRSKVGHVARRTR